MTNFICKLILFLYKVCAVSVIIIASISIFCVLFMFLDDILGAGITGGCIVLGLVFLVGYVSAFDDTVEIFKSIKDLFK